MVAPPRGLTLAEVMVAMGLSCLLLGVLFTFHLFALHMGNRQQRVSQNYRRIVGALDRVETLLGNADVLKADATDVVFAVPDPKQPLFRRFPLRQPELSTLALVDGALVLRQGDSTQTLLQLQSWEQLSFALYEDDDVNHTKRYLDIIATGNPPVRSAQEGREQPFSLVRRIYIEPQY